MYAIVYSISAAIVVGTVMYDPFCPRHTKVSKDKGADQGAGGAGLGRGGASGLEDAGENSSNNGAGGRDLAQEGEEKKKKKIVRV
eukprot:Nk52_evm6s167 gene=Nk52_evmTU6s167